MAATEIATREQFIESLGRNSVDEIKSLVAQHCGVQIKGTAKAQVLDEAYEAYVQHLQAPQTPAGADPKAVQSESTPPPAAPAPPPAAPAPPVERPRSRKPEPPKAPEASKPLRYEGRSRTGRPFHKLGRVFGPRWEPLGELTEDERKVLDVYAAHISYRIAE